MNVQKENFTEHEAKAVGNRRRQCVLGFGSYYV